MSLFSPTILPVISLWQPYASLTFARDAGGCFIKQHETRGFPLPVSKVGVTIAIHATGKFTPQHMISEDLHELCLDMFGCQYHETLARSAIIGTVRFIQCETTTWWRARGLVQPDNLTAGDWRCRDDKGRLRYGWLIDEAVPIDGGKSVLPWKGCQGWGSVPEEALQKSGLGHV